MDELPFETSSSPSALPTTNRRDTIQSLLTTGRPRSESALSSSEPCLRFPRPQGNRRLANWISTSNPDVMDFNAGSEESALAESAYELIAPASLDHDLHDDQYTGSMSESMCSLEFHRPDDANSLTGTEQTYDDESIIDDDAEPLSTSMIHEEAVDVHNGNHAPLQEREDDDSDEDAEEEEEEEEEARSRCSIEYTQHSLKTPSIMTPEASKILETFPEVAEKSNPHEGLVNNIRLAGLHDAISQIWDYAAGAASTVLPGLIFAASFTLLVNVLYPSAFQFANDPGRPSATSTVVATIITPVAIRTSRATSSATPTQGIPTKQPVTSVKGMGLIVINEKAPEEWLFGTNKPEIQLAPLGQGAIAVHVAPEVARAWSRKTNCLSVAAERDSMPVKVVYFQSPNGFAVKFPKNETYGVVKLTIQATCRPSASKAVTVHFGKGILEEAFEMTRNLASDISGLMPVAAHEAEKCLVGAKKSLSAVSDTVASGVLTASDNLLCRIKDSAHRMQALVGEQQSSFTKSARDVTAKLPLVIESVRTQLGGSFGAAPALRTGIRECVLSAHVYLVTSQISASMWWLSITGQKKKHDEYVQKAKAYIDGMRAKGRDGGLGRLSFRRMRNHKCCPCSKGSRCKKHEAKGKKCHMCKP